MSGTEFVPAHKIADADWDRVVRHSPLGQFWHYAAWRRYSLAFAGSASVDRSFGVLDAGRLVAVCALIEEPGGSFTMGGEPGPMPAAWSDEAMIAGLLHAHTVVKAAQPNAELTFRMPPQRTMAPCALKAVQSMGWTVGGWQTRIIGLHSAHTVLWRDVRKSYRSLIHKTERTHELVVSVGSALATAYQRLHMQTVGPIIPRPDATYLAQAQWLDDRTALLLGARNRTTGEWDGFVYLFLHHDLAYFGSAPMRPGTDVMHGLVWASIRECQARTLSRLEMGWQGHATDPKGKNIEFHKVGYGGADVPLETWTTP